MNIFKIAVTGSAGSGKSIVCRRFYEKGLVVLDCDVIARQVVEPGEKGFKDIVDLFGETVVLKDGRLDRARLREIIVYDDDMRKKMEDILHPRILEEMIFQMAHADYTGRKKAVAVEVPLLFETGMERYFDLTIAVIADFPELIDRISSRDKVMEKDARKMLELQMSQEHKSARADYVIKNTGTLPELFDSVDNIFEKIQKEFLTT
ncbi:MAG: dephospho-CoA kinase [Proteobacteria bacterium]|nr:dephospho-CoA kinase [Pseudomonadota bacterium]MBU1387074.1 dephospho-CoA kinase [Pseudomonadota bacterium]MBU1541609.1 dephospho-CoA kinase [Pseudomonadota bacterium]MBU2479507.1 dephospho-CoA kinase [Pseudomonadota bacterium]